MKPDRDTILATMYNATDDSDTDAGALPTTTRTRKIRVGIIEYEVPSIEYVQQLEQQIAQLTHTVERLEAAQRLQSGNLETMRHHMNRKQDSR